LSVYLFPETLASEPYPSLSGLCPYYPSKARFHSTYIRTYATLLLFILFLSRQYGKAGSYCYICQKATRGDEHCRRRRQPVFDGADGLSTCDAAGADYHTLRYRGTGGWKARRQTCLVEPVFHDRPISTVSVNPPSAFTNWFRLHGEPNQALCRETSSQRHILY